MTRPVTRIPPASIVSVQEQHASSRAATQPARKAVRLRALASRTAIAALTAAPDCQPTVLDAAEQLERIADGLERRQKSASSRPAIVELPSNATASEIRQARRRQAARRGTEVYLPCWSAMAQALPNAFLRSALFSAGRSVQADNSNLLGGEPTTLVAGKEIASLRNMTLTFSGFELCQFDRRVYATCLDYYRDAPLCPEESPQHFRTSFYEFARRMGNEYSVKAHRAIRASLLRLSFAQMRVRYERMNIEVPKLLSVTFEDGAATGDFRGSDTLQLRVTTSVAELFGPNAWTAVDHETAGYDDLKGWLANFYASHACAQWLPVETLYNLSGYVSHRRNFRTGLVRALEQLKAPGTPACSRVANYLFSRDGTRIRVVRSAWAAEPVEAD